jgi:tRNA-dihydrouridine synthase A
MNRPMNRAFSIAPMMDWTDRHCRAFHRTLTREALLYTEMVTSAAIKHGRRAALRRRTQDDGLLVESKLRRVL